MLQINIYCITPINEYDKYLIVAKISLKDVQESSACALMLLRCAFTVPPGGGGGKGNKCLWKVDLR